MPDFLSQLSVNAPQLIANILLSASTYLLIGISFYLVFYLTRIFHIFLAALITAGAYFVYWFNTGLHCPLWIAVLLAIVMTTGLGVASDRLVYQALRKRKAPSLSFLIASIGMYIIVQNLISTYFGDNTKTIQDKDVSVGYSFWRGQVHLTAVQILSIFIGAFLFLGIQLFLKFSKYGKQIRSVASNPLLSGIYGINTSRVTLITISISSMLAATAGILLAMDTNMTPTFGFNPLIYGIAAIMIGGLGSTWGLITGVILLSAAQQLVSYGISAKWSDAIAYLVLILFLLYKPLGFSGKRIKKIEI